MSIVEPDGAPADAPWLGAGVAAALVVCQLIFLAVGDGDTSGALAATAQGHGADLWWETIDGWIWPQFVAAIAPIATIPGAFGVKGRQLLSSMPRKRWWVVAAVVAVMCMADAAQIFRGHGGGFASAAGASWTHDGDIVAQHSWSEASQVLIGCEMGGKAQDSPKLIYEVTFPDGREALLDWTATMGRLETSGLTNWLNAVEPIDAALRRINQTHHIIVATSREAKCLSAYSAEVDTDTQPRLDAILNTAAPAP